jgi:NAD-dependent SIR2 family protein deacetylase
LLTFRFRERLFSYFRFALMERILSISRKSAYWRIRYAKLDLKIMAKDKTSKIYKIDNKLIALNDYVDASNLSFWQNLNISDFNKFDFDSSLKSLSDATLKLNVKKDDRRSKINEIRQFYKKEKLVFVLGAGVSMSFGLPGWDILLQKLMVATLEKDKNASTLLSKLFSRLFDPSPLIAGRYLQKYYETNNLSFEEAVRDILYQEIKRDCISPLMDEIIRYCIAPGKSPNLNSIITYNFDDILEECIKKISLDLPFKSIYGQGIDVDASELPIYHVHGFLPSGSNLTKEHQITFGESIYHKQYIDTYSWNNIVQINKFRENTCLFIGTSLTDPNTRRLLDISNQQRTEKKGSHFIFKLKNKSEDVKKALEILLDQNKDLMDEKIAAELKLDTTVNTLIQTIESFEENDLISFGIKTIWIDKYSEIPEILKEIRST